MNELLDMVPLWVFAALYVFVGIFSAIVRAFWRGNRGEPIDLDVTGALVFLWPILAPMLLVMLFCQWIWNAAFSRNLPPENQHPTAKPHQGRSKRW